ncbi:sensor histidine kinase [Rubritalea sp.]|uniref:sensor histidine kinase n=1 Tax=Rubritalea sp. TaxID=2109375 RepID=UPI003EF7598E
MNVLSPAAKNLLLNKEMRECSTTIRPRVRASWLGHGLRLPLFCGLCILTIFIDGIEAAEGYSDPLNPSQVEWGLNSSKVPFYEIPARIEKLEELISEETQALEALAPLQPAKQFDQFGYHSDYLPAVKGVPELPLWTLDFDNGVKTRRILGIVLVPAIDERSAELQGYAFPKRFRISSVNSKGEVERVYVDWTERDFPDPGMRPVVFKFPSQYALVATDGLRSGLRLEVFSGAEDNGLEFFSLARAHLIRTNEVHSPRRVTVSSSFESAPYWGAEYLSSPRHTLGMPLSSKNGSDGNLVWPLSVSKLDSPIVLRIELDKLEQLGWVSLFPGKSPDGIDVPGYGFPKSIRFVRLQKKHDRNNYRRLPVEDRSFAGNPGNNMVRVTDLGRKVDALEIELNDFPVYQGQPVLALGEIELSFNGLNISKGRNISLRHGDVEYVPDLSVLVDGRVDGRTVLPLPKWIDQLAAGKPHVASLATFEVEHSRLSERWQIIRERSLISFGVLLLFGVLAFVYWMRRSRKMAQLRLRQQIHSDLHDEVGSNLGSISIMAEQLENLAKDEQIKEGLEDLSLLGREAYASLREVIWLVDQSTIHLPVLLQKLAERAERVLNHAELSIEIPEHCPDQIVSLNFKRHLIMFFKEVVHNCARHAQASKVHIAVSITGKKLKLAVSDDGCGFDATEKFPGWGLSSLKKRAQEMGGEMELSSSSGKGTTIVLELPLASLTNEASHSYRTSN